MLNREQSITLLMLNNRRNEKKNPIGWLPSEIAEYIINFGYDKNPNSDIAKALRLAKAGEEKDLIELVEMIKIIPTLLLQAGDVVTRGGFHAQRKTLYQFFLAEGDPVGAKRIEFGFEKIPDGEKMRIQQYEEYKPHLSALAKQIESKKPSFDLIPLFDALIKLKDNHEINAALNNLESDLFKEMSKFENALKFERELVGMHYKHYTTLIQAFDLRYDRWEKLSNNYTNYDKCEFVWQKIIGGLQDKLPAVDRFPFARAFNDEERTVNFKYGTGSFPDADLSGVVRISGVGVDVAIFGSRCHLQVIAMVPHPWRARSLENTYRTKTSSLQNLCSHTSNLKFGV